MSKNVLYANEIATAGTWVKEHYLDINLRFLLADLQNPNNLKNMTHSDRWSECYEFLSSHYPDETDLATGLAYYVED